MSLASGPGSRLGLMMTRHQEINWIRLSGTVGQKLALRFETLQLLVTKLATSGPS
jgi:hypothetical protein